MVNINSGKSINTLTLSNVVHSSHTYLNYNRVTNHDAALLILHKLGGTATSRQIIEALKVFRRNPELKFTYLWNTSPSGGYGFVGGNVNSVSNRVFHQPANYKKSGCATQRRTYWYRVKRGTYALTTEGLRRLGELQAQLDC